MAGVIIGQFQPGPSTHISAPNEPIPPRNEVELTRDMLITILEYFSQLVAQLFTGRTIRMVVPGGACILLHPGLHQLSEQQRQMIPSLPRRMTTRVVTYFHRAFVAELASQGMPDAAIKIQECIKTTARRFGLGADWMNNNADIALPMAYDPSGKLYDPIYTASIKEDNINLQTVFRSTNGLLTLISVVPFWAVSFKLVRYTRWDPGDICLLFRHGMVLSGTIWTPDIVEKWLFENHWAMGYRNFDAQRKADLRARIVHAIQLLSKLSRVQPPEKGINAHNAMGGGEYGGWSYSFGTWPNQAPQQQQAQVSSIQFPAPPAIPRPYLTDPGSNIIIQVPASPSSSSGSSTDPYRRGGSRGGDSRRPAPTPVPVNVRDWATDNEPPQHQQRKSRSPSPYSHSRRSSTGKSREILIPPDIDWINPHQAPASFRPRSRNPTPDPVADRWDNVYPQESFGTWPNQVQQPQAQVGSIQFPVPAPIIIHDSPHSHQTPDPIADNWDSTPSSIRAFDRSISLLLRQGRHPNAMIEESPWHNYARSTSANHPPQIHITPLIQPQQGLQDPPQLPKHRLPLDLSPPAAGPSFSVAPLPPVTHMPILQSPPLSLGPAQLAQYQFEQQQREYQFQQGSSTKRNSINRFNH